MNWYLVGRLLMKQFMLIKYCLVLYNYLFVLVSYVHVWYNMNLFIFCKQTSDDDATDINQNKEDTTLVQNNLVNLIEFAMALRDQMDSINEQSFNTFMLQIGELCDLLQSWLQKLYCDWIDDSNSIWSCHTFAVCLLFLQPLFLC